MQCKEFCCTMNSERGILNDATQEVYGQVRGNSDSRSERESGCTYVCGVSGVRVTGGTESVLPVPAWPGLPERRVQRGKAEHSGESGYLRRRPGFCLRCPGSWGSDSGLSY